MCLFLYFFISLFLSWIACLFVCCRHVRSCVCLFVCCLSDCLFVCMFALAFFAPECVLCVCVLVRVSCIVCLFACVLACVSVCLFVSCLFVCLFA